MGSALTVVAAVLRVSDLFPVPFPTAVLDETVIFVTYPTTPQRRSSSPKMSAFSIDLPTSHRHSLSARNGGVNKGGDKSMRQQRIGGPASLIYDRYV